MTTPSRKPRILVVDDEPQIRQVLSGFLAARDFDVRDASDGDRALAIFKEWAPNLIITDLSMPRMGGISLCRELRRHSSVPILVLSVRDEEAMKVEALESGADDYVTKPFGMDELLARVRASLRRAMTVAPVTEVVEVGDFRLNSESHRAEIKGRGDISLTPKEFELLAFLMNNPDRVITQRALLEDIWGRTYSDQSDSVRALVRQLRKKIEKNPASPKYLKTEPWVGYRFEPGH
jgi:two-component system KDP operon response regulator KdpE